MRTVTEQNRGAMGLKVIGVAVTALVIGAWILPSGAQMERVPVGPVNAEAEIAPDVNADRALSVYISFPATFQDGQYCVAYGIASGGTPPYSFYWEALDDTWDGPLGSDQIGGGYFSGTGTLRLSVVDSSTPSKTGAADIGYEGTDEYNPDCDG